MKIVCLVPHQKQVSALMDDLKNLGYDRKDIIITDLNNQGDFISDNTITNVKSDRDGINENMPFYAQFSDDLGYINTNENGIIISVEVPSKSSTKIKNLMKRNGATKFLHE